MAPFDSYGGPSYTGRNRSSKDGGPKAVQRSHASSLKEHEPLFNTYEHLSGLQRGDEALTLLRKVASMVKPIMSKRSWKVSVLAEFLPEEQNLLGLNINKGYKICIRLRYHNNPDLFLPFEQVVDTMLHELSHIIWSEHDSRFHALWDELRDEHETLLRKGYTGEGFLGEGKKLGGVYGGRAPPPYEMRRLAKASAEKRKTQSTLSSGSGRRLGGAPLTHGQDVREVIAGQTLLRNTINRGCASGTKNADKLAEQSANLTFKTKAEEDDANDRAISQAIFELMEEEEAVKLKGTFEDAPTKGGLAWSEDHGLYDPGSERPRSRDGRRAPTEDEQLEWAMAESLRASNSDLESGLPPESLISPISPFTSKKGEANTNDGHAHALLSPVSPMGSDQSSLKPKLSSRAQPDLPPASASVDLPITSVDISEPFNPDQWTCQVCSLINPLLFLTCDACGVERPQPKARDSLRSSRPTSRVSSKAPSKPAVLGVRPSASASKKHESLGWGCSRCGAFMEHKWWSCSACGNMKEKS
jgi:hypothetical protein